MDKKKLLAIIEGLDDEEFGLHGVCSGVVAGQRIRVMRDAVREYPILALGRLENQTSSSGLGIAFRRFGPSYSSRLRRPEPVGRSPSITRVTEGLFRQP